MRRYTDAEGRGVPCCLAFVEGLHRGVSALLMLSAACLCSWVIIRHRDDANGDAYDAAAPPALPPWLQVPLPWHVPVVVAASAASLLAGAFGAAGAVLRSAGLLNVQLVALGVLLASEVTLGDLHRVALHPVTPSRDAPDDVLTKGPIARLQGSAASREC